MTTLPLVPLAATFGAIALLGIAALLLHRRVATCCALVPSETCEPDVADDGELHVPFTQLGVDVEAPSAPDWSSRATTVAPLTPVPRSAPLAIGDIDRATSVLRDHVRSDSSSVASWLILLELYRTHGREQALGELATEFRERFRCERDGARAMRGGADGGLEAFPPVMRLVTMLWGTDECRDLLLRLARDRSEGRRLGLSRAAYVDIATLAQLNDTLLAEIEADRAEDAKVRAAWRTAAYVAQVRCP